MITMNLKDLPEELTEEEKKMLERAEKASITFDEDCPELTEEQLKPKRDGDASFVCEKLEKSKIVGKRLHCRSQPHS